MRRFLYLLAILISTAIPVHAQLSYPADTYSGYSAVPCTNTSTTFEVVSITVNGQVHKVWCSPLGHALFCSGPVVSSLSDNSAGHADESGTTVHQYRTAKFGSDANFYTMNHQRMQSWGYNCLGQYKDQTETPVGGSITPAMPFVVFNIVSLYSLTNKLGWGTGPAKEIYYILSSHWPAGQKFDGHADWLDPNVAGMAAGTHTNSPNLQQVAASTAFKKGYILGEMDDDSDNGHCTGAGPSFPTTPTGHADFSCGAVGLFIAPVNYSNSVQGQLYTNGKVFWKSGLHDAMVTKYGTVGALNTSWGSTYTTMDSSGTCIGPQPSGIACTTTNGTPFNIGVGNGVTLTFANSVFTLPVSHFSMGIFVNGVLVGGDTGSGAIFGPNLSGTINYTTGAVNLIFTPGHAPANGTFITTSYIANGWGLGTGFMDEDGRNSWIGADISGLTDFPANVQTDINAYTTFIAHFYANEMCSATQTWAGAHGFVGHFPCLGPGTLGTWSGTPSKYVIQGVCGVFDAVALGGVVAPTQAMLNDVDAACPGLPLIQYMYTTATADSEFRWVNSATVHNSGKSVTSTFATPSKLTVATLVSSTCVDPTFNTHQTRPASNTSNTLTYNATNTPGSSSTTCTVQLSDDNNGGFSTQGIRGASEAATITAAITAAPNQGGNSGIRPFIGVAHWNLWPDWADVDWGVTSYRDNAYDGGTEDANAIVPCSAPLAALNCGGELTLHGPPYGNFIGPIKTANAAIVSYFLGANAAPPPAPAPFFAWSVSSSANHLTSCPVKCPGPTLCLSGDGLFFSADCKTWQPYPTGIIPTSATTTTISTSTTTLQ